jgi:hypothetical protein
MGSLCCDVAHAVLMKQALMPMSSGWQHFLPHRCRTALALFAVFKQEGQIEYQSSSVKPQGGAYMMPDGWC